MLKQKVKLIQKVLGYKLTRQYQQYCIHITTASSNPKKQHELAVHWGLERYCKTIWWTKLEKKTPKMWTQNQLQRHPVHLVASLTHCECWLSKLQHGGFNWTETLFLSTMLLLSFTSECGVCSNHAHSTICCTLFPHKALQNITAIRNIYMRLKNGNDNQQKPSSSTCSFRNNYRANNNLPPFYSFRRVIMAMHSASSVPSSAKNWNQRITGTNTR